MKAFRWLSRKILLFQANLSIRKHKANIIVIYGWDWSEVVREALYNLMFMGTDIRRNTAWIDWDMGLPLFVLGLPYQSKKAKRKLFYYLFLSFIVLLKPKRLRNHYLVVSLHAKSDRTLNYWTKIVNIRQIVLLPVSNARSQIKQQFLKDKFSDKKIIDLSNKKQLFAAPKLEKVKYPIHFNNIQNLVLGYLAEINNSYLSKQDFNFSDQDLVDAVAKIDWEKFFLERVQANLVKED